MKLTHSGAVAYQIKDNQILFLIVSSSNGQHWVLPKGHIESDERPEMTALRELLEEAGIIGKLSGKLAIQEFKKFEENVVAQYYLVQALEITAAEEQRTLRWETETNALALLSFEESRNALIDGAHALEHMQAP